MKPPAFQLYADDFIAGTCDLSALDVGAYIRLLCYQWNRGSIPTDDLDRLARIAGAPVSPDVLAKFPRGKNKRMEEVRKKQEDYRAAQSLKGKASAKARFNRGSTDVECSVQPEANSPSPTPSPTPDIYKKKERSAVASPASDSEWLASLKENPAYDGLNIGVIYGKMQAWCGANKKQPTRRRFINWLNREEKPMPRQIQIASSSKPVQEPENWREKLKQVMPDSNYTGSYATLPDSIKEKIIKHS